MRKLLLLLFSLTLLVSAAQKANTVFTTDTLIYYGIDFSQCRMIGNFKEASPAELKQTYFSDWNRIVVKEKEKYDLEKTFSKKKVIYDMESVAAENEDADESKILSSDADYKLDAATIKNMVEAYDKNEYDKGIGLVFIAETFNKTTEKAYFYATFFDIATDKVFFSERVSGSASGAGLRNYWANAFSHALKTIKTESYGQWKTKYTVGN